ncbi:MAG: EI24 domain-containing protein [Planctomycetes bacterium]|nr:EI24 domain-containing protein [Planctomycetota bacterium]
MERCAVCGNAAREGGCARCNGEVARADLLSPLRRRGPAELLVGLALALRGAALTLSRPRLLALVIAPLVLNVLVFALLVWLVIAEREAFRPELAAEWVYGLDWLRLLLQEAAVYGAVLLGILAAAGGTVLGSAVVAAPFLEWLSEAVESVVLGRRDETPITLEYVWSVWIAPVFQAAGVALLQACAALLFLVLSLTGVLAPLVFLGGAWLTAVTLCDVVVARKCYPISARFRLVNRSLLLHLGLALPFAVLPFLLPLGVAGATLAYLRERGLRAGA